MPEPVEGLHTSHPAILECLGLPNRLPLPDEDVFQDECGTVPVGRKNGPAILKNLLADPHANGTGGDFTADGGNVDGVPERGCDREDS